MVATSPGQTTSTVAEYDTEEFGHEPTRKPNKLTLPGSCTANPVELLVRDLISPALTMELAQAPVEAQTFCSQLLFPGGCRQTFHEQSTVLIGILQNYLINIYLAPCSLRAAGTKEGLQLHYRA